MKTFFKNFFKPAVKEVLVAERIPSGKYSPEIEQIHYEFETASDILLAQAIKYIEEANNHPVEKVKRLLNLGFAQAKQIDETKNAIQQAELSKEQRDLLMEYKRKYPFNKFITEEQVKVICYKYNLVCGSVSKYRGFVPEKNMREIECFKIRNEDMLEVEVIDRSGNRVGYASYSDIPNDYMRSTMKEKGDSWYVEHHGKSINLKGGDAKWGESSKMRGVVGRNILEICAPIKDMDMAGMTIVDGYRVKKIHIPDPVVLHPVKGGYLILTAWGDEASDPLVVNEINN